MSLVQVISLVIWGLSLICLAVAFLAFNFGLIAWGVILIVIAVLNAVAGTIILRQ